MANIGIIPKKHFLGVDIGTTSIKAVEVIFDPPGKIDLVNYGILDVYGYLDKFTDVIQTASLKIAAGEAAKDLFFLVKKMNPGTRKVVASIPTFSAFTTRIDVPVVNAKEVQAA